MRKILTVLICLTYFVSCQENRPLDGYIVNGTINKTHGTVYLLDSKLKTKDSATIKNGKFVFKGKVDNVDEYNIVVKDSYYPKSFFLENYKYDIHIVYDTLSTNINITFKGGKLDKEYDDYRKMSNRYSEMVDSISSLNKKPNKKGDTILQQKIDSLTKKVRKDYYNKVQHNLNSDLAPFILLSIYRDIESKKEYKKLPQKVKMSTGGRRLKKRMDKEYEKLIKDKRILSGNFLFPDVTFIDLNKKHQNVQSLIKNNKITLVDFWASWCGPCRAQNPKLKEIYSKYKKDDFEIIGISIDKTSQPWKKAVKDDELPWPQLLDSTKSLSKPLNFNAIPTNFLVDQSGKVMDKNMAETDLTKVLDSIFNK